MDCAQHQLYALSAAQSDGSRVLKMLSLKQNYLGAVVHIYNSSTWETKFKALLSYRLRPCLNTTTKPHPKPKCKLKHTLVGKRESLTCLHIACSRYFSVSRSSNLISKILTFLLHACLSFKLWDLVLCIPLPVIPCDPCCLHPMWLIHPVPHPLPVPCTLLLLLSYLQGSGILWHIPTCSPCFPTPSSWEELCLVDSPNEITRSLGAVAARGW